jgi:hypothetical protein
VACVLFGNGLIYALDIMDVVFSLCSHYYFKFLENACKCTAESLVSFRLGILLTMTFSHEQNMEVIMMSRALGAEHWL